MTHRYLCSMGANIAPEKNFERAQQSVAQLGSVHFSSARYTQPVAIVTEHDFLNALFIIECELNAEQLKERFNSIEEQLGRDRSDPLSSEKDRPMDIDILGELSAENARQAWQEVPSYLAEIAHELKSNLSHEELIA